MTQTAKKFELTSETKVFEGRTLHRIRALKDFGLVEQGQLGGWVEKEENLSQEGNCWIADDACVFGNACVFGKARVSGNAWVSDNAGVFGYVWVFGKAEVSGKARVSGKECINSGTISE